MSNTLEMILPQLFLGTVLAFFTTLFIVFPLSVLIYRVLRKRRRWRTHPNSKGEKNPSWLADILTELREGPVGFILVLCGGSFATYLILLFLQLNFWLVLPTQFFLTACYHLYVTFYDAIVSRRKAMQSDEPSPQWLTSPDMGRKIGEALMLIGAGIIALNLTSLIDKIQPLLWMVFQAAIGGGMVLLIGYLYYQFATFSQQRLKKGKETLPPKPLTRPNIQ